MRSDENYGIVSFHEALKRVQRKYLSKDLAHLNY